MGIDYCIIIRLKKSGVFFVTFLLNFYCTEREFSSYKNIPPVFVVIELVGIIELLTDSFVKVF